jgi:hypothetical protein
MQMPDAELPQWLDKAEARTAAVITLDDGERLTAEVRDLNDERDKTHRFTDAQALTAAPQLRHSNPRVTLGRYAHVVPQSQGDAVEGGLAPTECHNKVSPDYVPFSAVHETIHFNQTYQTSGQSALPWNLVSEGTAEFIASLVLPERAVRQSHGPLAVRLRARGCTGSAYGARRGLNECGALDVQPQSGHGLAAGYGLLRIDPAFYAQAKDRTGPCEPCWA